MYGALNLAFEAWLLLNLQQTLLANFKPKHGFSAYGHLTNSIKSEVLVSCNSQIYRK